jgi:hypothetical protein
MTRLRRPVRKIGASESTVHDLIFLDHFEDRLPEICDLENSSNSNKYISRLHLEVEPDYLARIRMG